MLSRIQVVVGRRGIVAASIVYGAAPSAQSMAATLSGTVKDPIGRIHTRRQDQGDQSRHSRVEIADEERKWNLCRAGHGPGTYDVSVEKQGFKTAPKTGIVGHPQDRLSLGEMVLQVGASTDSVTVTADAGQLQLQADSGERSAAVTNTQLRDLALNGRNIHDLAKMIPGVAQPGGANEVSNLSAIGSYSINGTGSP